MRSKLLLADRRLAAAWGRPWRSPALIARWTTCAQVERASLRPHVCGPQHRTLSSAIQAQSGRGGGLGDEDLDVAVFRFTLGIPGFEDRFIPRVVGAAGALLLVVNHVFGAQPAPAAQVRAEFLILGLALLCVVVPEVEERLREALPGRGRQRMADRIEGAVNGFLLQPGLPEAAKQELAWSSVSLIKNTNSCGVLVVRDGRTVLARGALGSTLLTPRNKDPQAALEAISEDLARLALKLPVGSEDRQAYLADQSAMGKAGFASAASLPAGAQSVLVQCLDGAPGEAGSSFMLLYSERPRSLSDKERKWAAAIAKKLSAVSLA